MNELESRGVRWAVVDRTWLVDRRRARLDDFDIAVAFDRDDVVVIKLPVEPDAVD